MENKDNIGFSLRKLTTQQFAIIEDVFKEGENVEMKTSVNFGIDTSKKMIAVYFNVKFLQKNTAFLLLETASHFHIHEDSWSAFENSDKTELIVPKGFISHLVMLSIGTTRGVLHSKTENTVYNKFLLPTINVINLIKEDTKFKIT
jgi:hypothetical protein